MSEPDQSAALAAEIAFYASLSERELAILMNIGALVLARLIVADQLDPSSIASREELTDVIRTLGTSEELAFEVHIERVPEKLKSIEACRENGDAESAVVLIFTLVEGEVNTALQILLRVNGFSRAKVTDALKGVDLMTKLDVLLPLLGVDPGGAIRQLVAETKAVRHATVHYKARPDIWRDSGDVDGDHHSIRAKAGELLRAYGSDRLREVIDPFVAACVSQCRPVQEAVALLHRFRHHPS